ncbi:unnamed protein product [Cylicocyclus nassatus]|uniref:Sterol regulatory element-binding protein cleavage-activating protein n=1 Tax=Cylicocyclus nassatus TaxID=53992 RepID=A0AA36HA19_CYLNA|nr:unnamed protein product [Cylicocyclus nassatus]
MSANRSVSLRERVAQAYHDYGRFCSAHPAACLSMSLITMVVLSYPTFTRFRLPTNSPISVDWTDKLYEDSGGKSWARARSTFLQQVIIRGSVEPWVPMNLSSEQAVRGPLSRAFLARNIILAQEEVDALCLQVVSDNVRFGSFTPQRGCLLLEPTAFWGYSYEKFMSDKDVLATIFSRECSSVACPRDLLLGMPFGFTGIKKIYRSNQKPTIDISLTLFLVRYDKDARQSLISRFTSHPEFKNVPLITEEENKFAHVLFRPRRTLVDYLPLLSSYAVFTFYLYFSARKFEMVASRCGLALAAAFTVGSTLLMTTGVCAHLELSPTLWGAEIFPYIALILGLENILCITRAVVYTPPFLDVSSRISHGLAQEGYSLCKYFVMELTFLGIGYATRIAEIQEFCMFASIGLVIDFYMQMFFYAPCLTFDLQRLRSEDKQQFALKLFSSDIPHLHDFVPVRCPMRKYWPQFFEMKRLKKRTLSESQLDDREIQEDFERKGRCRSNSACNSEWNYDAVSSTGRISSNRLRVLYFVTRTRIFQRTIMVIFALWTIWLAFVVHEHGHFPFNTSSGSDEISAGGSAPQHWQTWTDLQHRSWLKLFAEFSLSHSSGAITFVPPIILTTKIDPSDPALYPRPSSAKGSSQKVSSSLEKDNNALKSRISWLERQLHLYLAIMWLILLSSVIGFVLYACFWGKWRTERLRKKEASLASPRSLSPRTSVLEPTTDRKSPVENEPIISFGHRFPIECVAVCNNSSIVSCCQEGKVCLWNAETGERLLKLRRIRDVSNPALDTSTLPMIWCIAAKQSITVCGCSDGSVEIACLERNKLIGVYLQSRIGVIHVLIAGSRIVLARLDGSIDFLELCLTPERPIRVTSITRLNTIRAHQKPISFLLASSLTVVSASYDHTLKLFDLRSSQLQSMLHAHRGPVISVCVDNSDNTLFSACEEGFVCWWNMMSGELLRTINTKSVGRTLLACTVQFLLGYSPEGDLILWNKRTGDVVSRIAQHLAKFESAVAARNLIALNNDIVAVTYESTLTFWDLEHKALIRQIDLGSVIDHLHALGDQSVLCQCSNTVYRITTPKFRIA